MLKTGLCSVSFKQKSVTEVISLTKQAKLDAIEWIGNTHVPAGDIKNAHNVGQMTRNAGLELSSYGSLFYLGENDDIVPHLETAAALGTNSMRIWAGKIPSREYSEKMRETVVLESIKICEIAKKYNIALSTECHSSSLTDCFESHLLFLQEVNSPNFKTYWQELFSFSEEEQLSWLSKIHNSGKLTNIHIYQYEITDSARIRQPLSFGFTKWLKRFEFFKSDDILHYAMLEFVGDYTTKSLFDDAKTLRELTYFDNHIQL